MTDGAFGRDEHTHPHETTTAASEQRVWDPPSFAAVRIAGPATAARPAIRVEWELVRYSLSVAVLLVA